MCISRAAFGLGLRGLARKWLAKAVDTVAGLGLSDVEERAGALLRVVAGLDTHARPRGGKAAASSSDVLSRIKRNVKRKTAVVSVEAYSLYGGSLPAFADGCDEKPRLLVHFALEALKKNLKKIALATFKGKEIAKICASPTPPSHHNELLHGINAKIIIQVQEDNMAGAVQTMRHRIDMVSKWTGNASFELANDKLRLACFHSLLGQHKECAAMCQESLDIGAGYDYYDSLGCLKMLATSLDATDNQNDMDNAIHIYECALSMEKDITTKVRLMNALSHLYLKVGGKSQLAVEYLDKSINILEGDAQNADTHSLLLSTIIMYGNAMVSINSFSEAMCWYDLALSENPNQSALHPINYKAWYNKVRG